jgi:hypothetical protein
MFLINRVFLSTDWYSNSECVLKEAKPVHKVGQVRLAILSDQEWEITQQIQLESSKELNAD